MNDIVKLKHAIKAICIPFVVLIIEFILIYFICLLQTDSKTQDQIIYGICPIIIIILILYFKHLKIKKIPQYTELLTPFFIGVCLNGIVYCIVYLLKAIPALTDFVNNNISTNEYYNGIYFFILFPTVIFITPIKEELIYRYLIGNELLNFNSKVTIIGTSLIFAFAHSVHLIENTATQAASMQIQIINFIYSFILGLFLCKYYIEKDLYHSIVFHIGFNLSGLLFYTLF